MRPVLKGNSNNFSASLKDNPFSNWIYLFQIFFEDLAEQEKAARLLNEPSPLVDYLNDDLQHITSGSGGNSSSNNEDQQRPMMMSKKSKKDREKNGGQGTFNIDQFPSLPQPASKNGSIFDRDAEW